MSTAITDVANNYHELGLVHIVQNAKELVQMATIGLSISDRSECKEQVAAFFKSINAVKEKKGCLLIQFPPSLERINIFQLNKL